MADLKGTWQVAPEFTEQTLLTSDPSANASVLVFIKNNGPNAVLIKYGFDVFTLLQPGQSLSLVQKVVMVVAARKDGSPATTPTDGDALASQGEFELTPMCCYPSPSAKVPE